MGYSAFSLSVNNKNSDISVPRGASLALADAAEWEVDSLPGEPGLSHLSERRREPKF